MFASVYKMLTSIKISKMKRIAFIALAIVLMTSCKDKAYHKYKCYEPVYSDAETFRTPANFESSRTISQNGNIYFKDNYLFVVEPNKGIHFIDNNNPENPINTGFLNVKGTSGLAIKGNYLYITALVDLVIVDVSSFANPVEVKRVEEAFPMALPLMAKNYPTKTIDKSLGIVVDWKVVETKEDVNESPVWTGCWNCETFALNSFTSSTVGGGSVGTSGSYAQMAILGDYLYVIDNWQLRPFDISNPTNPNEGEPSYLSWDVETIFPYENYLYMGTTTGMMIYNTTNPSAPQWEGAISHARACDPVVVQDNYAYVTVRSGGSCGGDINQLDVVDVSNKSNPQLVRSFNMKDPHGVGISGNTLFVCDGNAGLKMFDATNPGDVGNQLIKKNGNIDAVDVIPMNGVAMVIAENGIFQYDYSDPNKLKLLSEIRF